MKKRLPRPNTRVRAVFDMIFKNHSKVKNTRWHDAKDAYDNAPPAYNHKPFGPRRHSSMEIARILRKFCRRVSRGQYEMKEDWYDFALNIEVAKATAELDRKVIARADHLLKPLIPRNCGEPECTTCTVCKCGHPHNSEYHKMESAFPPVELEKWACRCGFVNDLPSIRAEKHLVGGYFHSVDKCTEPPEAPPPPKPWVKDLAEQMKVPKKELTGLCYLCVDAKDLQLIIDGLNELFELEREVAADDNKYGDGTRVLQLNEIVTLRKRCDEMMEKWRK